MTGNEVVEYFNAMPNEGEEVTKIISFKQTELKKTIISAKYVFEELEKLICAGKSFRAELRCSAETDGNHTAKVFIYAQTKPDEDCTPQEH